jgi:uncharacterized protein
VLGNHDRGAGPFHSDCGFACADAPALIGGIECRHRPIARDNVSGPLALAGHLHPVVRLNGPGRDSLRTPCFVMGERQIVLPAFGEFTGGSLVTPGGGERALIATARGVFDVTRGPGTAWQTSRLSDRKDSVRQKRKIRLHSAGGRCACASP